VKRSLLGSLCAVFALSGVVLAQAPQNYEGVVPGSATLPEHLAAAPGGDPVVTWPGFQMTPDGASRLFVMTTIEVKAEVKHEGGNLLVVIPGVKLPAGNSRLPLDTHFFNTPLKSARLTARGEGGVVLHMELKPGTKVSPGVHSEKGPNGYYFLYIEFPAGNFAR
jgi:hypothetical protein